MKQVEQMELAFESIDQQEKRIKTERWQRILRNVLHDELPVNIGNVLLWIVQDNRKIYVPFLDTHFILYDDSSKTTDSIVFVNENLAENRMRKMITNRIKEKLSGKEC